MIAESLGVQRLGFLQGSTKWQSGIHQSGMVSSSFRAGVGHSKASQLDRESRDVTERISSSWGGSQKSREKVLQQGLLDWGKGISNVRDNPLEIGPFCLQRLSEGSKGGLGYLLVAPEISLMPPTHC